MITKINISIIMLIGSLSLTAVFGGVKTDPVKITPPQAAPTFSTTDVYGNAVDLSDYKGKKILLTFFRNVGCPVCNLRFHELEEQAEYFKSKGLVLLAVYESSKESMKGYLEGESPYTVMIPNPDLSLYNSYHIERSTGKMMKGMFHGAMKKMKKGKKLFKNEIKQDGNTNRITADFLIDENGNVVSSYYGKYIGDHLSIASIKDFLK